MGLSDLVAGSYGSQIIIELREDGRAVDVSSFSSYSVYLRSPAGATIQKTAQLYTDGTDGRITFQIAHGDLNETGTWWLQAEVADATRRIRSRPIQFYVQEAI